MLATLKNRDFSHIFWAGLTSQLGSFVTETALMLYVFALSGQDKSVLGLSKASFLIFLTIGSLLGGGIGARYNRKKVLIVCEVLRIPLVISLFFFKNVYYIILADSLIAFFTGIFNPSRQTLINEVTSKDEIQGANSLFSTTLAFIHMVGPLLGAWLYSNFGGINEILSFDLATYFIGIYLISRISLLFQDDDESKSSSFAQDLKDGLTFMTRRSDLNGMLICVILTGFCIGVLVPLLLPFTTEYLQSDEKTYGILMGFFGVGGILGAPLYQKLTQYFTSAKIIVVGFLLEPLIMLFWSRVSIPSLSMFIIFIWGIAVFVRIPAQLTYFSQTIELKYLSRVHALLDMAFIVPNIFGSLFISMIGNTYSAQETLAGISILFFAVIYIGVFARYGKAILNYSNELN